jgi:hypothetical protein
MFEDLEASPGTGRHFFMGSRRNIRRLRSKQFSVFVIKILVPDPDPDWMWIPQSLHPDPKFSESGTADGLDRLQKKVSTLIKKKIKFSSYIKKIQSGAAKSYMRKGFLIYEEMRNEEAVSHI